MLHVIITTVTKKKQSHTLQGSVCDTIHSRQKCIPKALFPNQKILTEAAQVFIIEPEFHAL